MVSGCLLLFYKNYNIYQVPLHLPQILTTHAMEEADHLCTRIGKTMSPNLLHESGCGSRDNELWSSEVSWNTDATQEQVRFRLPAAVSL